MSAGQRRRRSSQGLTLAAARRRSSAAAWAAALEASTSGYEGEDKPVLRREEFICSDSHNAHLQEDFLEDKSRLFGRPLPSTAHGRSRSNNNPSGLKHVSSERLLRKFFHSAADTQSLRSVPDDRVPTSFLETVREEPKRPLRVDGNSATARLQEAAAQPTAEVPTASSALTSTPPPSKPPRKIWRRSKRTSSRGHTEADPESGPGTTVSPISNGNCPRAEAPKSRVGEEEALTTGDDRLDVESLSTRANRKPETESSSTSGSIRSGRLIRQNSARRPLSSCNAEESACKLYKRASLTHSRAPDPDAGGAEDSPTTNCVAPDRPRRIKRESLIHPPMATRRETALGTGTLAMPTFHNGRFENPWPTWRKPSIWAAIKWKLTTKNHTALPTSEKELDRTLPIVSLSRDIQTPPQDGIRVTWMGHSTTLVQFDDISVMTDPMMSERASPSTILGPKRFRRFPGTVHDLPKLDAVVISHNHYDHLDYNSVVLLNARFGADLHWFVPLGLGSWLRNTGCQSVTELSWWGEGSLPQNGATAFVFTPAQHWSKRTFTDDNTSLWGSWCILGPRHRFFFAGDTGYCTGFREIGEQYGPFDLAAIPIGAYEPRSMMGPQHVDPEQAVKIHQDVRAKRSVGIHWGTFALASEYYLDPPRRLAEEVDKAGLAKEDFFVLKHGESRLFVRL